MIAYIPVFLLVHLFKRTSSRKSKAIQIENEIKNSWREENKSLLVKKTSLFFIFPWWFKLILYGFSFICMALSIVLIIFKGENDFLTVNFHLRLYQSDAAIHLLRSNKINKGFGNVFVKIESNLRTRKTKHEIS